MGSGSASKRNILPAKFYRHFEQLVNAIFKTNHPWRKLSSCHYCIEICTQCQAWKKPKIYTLDSTCASQVFRNESKLNLGKGKILTWFKQISLHMDRKYCAHLNSWFMNCKSCWRCFQFGPILKEKKSNPCKVPQIYTLGWKVKVRTFWEAHKIWKNLPHGLYTYLVNIQTMRKIFSNCVCFSESPNFNGSFFRGWEKIPAEVIPPLPGTIYKYP